MKKLRKNKTLNIFEELKDGSFALFITEGNAEYYHADISWYLISDWNSEIENGEYFELIENHKIEYSHLEHAIEDVKTNFEQHTWAEKLTWNLPVIMVNFDKKHLINNFPDQPLEDYVPKKWKGEYVAKRENFLELIPDKANYWKSINL